MIEPYAPSKHYEVIKSWILGRKNGVILPPEYFPKIGFISPGLAAVFLYQTDSVFGLVENLIANPKASVLERDEALNEVINATIEKAKELGMKALAVMSAIDAVKKRALFFGCDPVLENMTYFIRRL